MVVEDKMEALDLAKYAGYALGAYTALLFGAELVQDAISRRIHSQEELETVVKEEAEQLGMNPNSILSSFYRKENPKYNSIWGASCSKDYYYPQKDEFVSPEDIDRNKLVELNIIELREGRGATRGTVRHELYHLFKHLPRESNSKLFNFLRGFFYEEPTAVLYSLTGVKI
jgi:hypothetical protein